ncbi:MAG TPA: response regulator [Vitreimonas sp.]|uniref:response regulator n=1 Tax=Vitreimonas sp. TaxID=3069702 RepID=UPI002D70424A|nr:response regulator [Vitreimonas sp.]HYD89625.1 response regulator [Vitreimonas sp.]
MAQPAAAYAFDAFEAMPDPVALLAADGALLRANAPFRDTFRHWIGPQRPPWGRVQAPEFVKGERRFEAPAPDGRRFEWAERVLPDGARLAIARDITRHVEAAEDALRAKTTLFATLTHELRTPLNGILGMANLLDLGELAPNAKTYVGAIKQSGELLLDIITEILDYSRLEAGRVVLESAPFDPEATMQDVAELLSPKAHDKGLEIAVTIRGEAPARVIGDDGRLRQILFNLAGNAVKFTEQGGVTIELAQRPNGRLRFNVRDTGPGVAPEKQALIFEEFAQADAGVARRHGGTGLGLAIVKKLAHAMGGEVGLVSRPGFGASFWVELPLPPAEDAPSPPPSLTGVRACVLSRSQLLAQALRGSLASLGAQNVEREDRPDLLLFDWRDDVDGEEIDALKRSARAVIALIAQEERETIERCRAAGLEHYTLKPVRRRSLAERIKVALGEADGKTLAHVQQADAAPLALTGLRVLLAEDNPINALLARTLLSRAGCVVTDVRDGEEAVAAAAAAAFDLILLDIRMPRLDGLAAAQRIRAGGGRSAAAPIVALTADAGEAERVQARRAGMDDFVTKPIDAGRLLAVAARFTGRPNPATFAEE